MTALWASFKRYGIMSFVCVAIGFTSGWCSRPAEMHEKSAERSVSGDTKKDSKKVMQAWVGDQAQSANVKYVTHTVYLPSGAIASKTETAETATASSTHDRTESKTEEASERIIYREHAKSAERTTINSKAPTWLVAVQVGTSIPGLAGARVGGLPMPYAGVVGGSVSRHIIGPGYLGIWGNTTGAVGLQVTGAF
jgi:hypothetical protein